MIWLGCVSHLLFPYAMIYPQNRVEFDSKFKGPIVISVLQASGTLLEIGLEFLLTYLKFTGNILKHLLPLFF